MREAVIVSGVRTPIGSEAGALKDIPAERLGALAIREAVQRSGLQDLGLIDEVIFGHCLGSAGGLGRWAALAAGLPISTPAITIDRQCGSGSTAVNLAAAYIQSNAGDVIIAGGAESMTRMPYFMEKPASPFQRIPPPLNILHSLAPPEIGDPQPMGMWAENIAERFGVSREEQDEFAYLSQLKTAIAIKERRFEGQILPVIVPQKKGEPIVFDADEHPRPGITREALARLGTPFRPFGGSVTAGNSSGINDAAAAMVIASLGKAEELGMKPLAKVVSHGASAVDPNITGMAPVPATRKALVRAGLDIDEMDIIELNEAFASQCVACCRELEIDWRGKDRDRLNPNGGAIALGHPIAATLAILTIKAMYELHRREGRYGLITACCGGGQGVATIIERCWSRGEALALLLALFYRHSDSRREPGIGSLFLGTAARAVEVNDYHETSRVRETLAELTVTIERGADAMPRADS